MRTNDDRGQIALVMEGWGKGGTETYVRGLSGTLASHGEQPTLVVLRESSGAIDHACRPVAVHGWIGLFMYLLRQRPRLLNLHLYSSLLPATIAAKLLGIRVIATLHMPPSAWGLRHRIGWRIAARLADKVVGVSRLVLQEVRSRNAHERPVPGGVAACFFECPRQHSRGEIFRIAALGRLAPEKDWPTLLQAVGTLAPAERDRVVVDFYGTGPMLDTLRADAERLHVSAVFHGHVDRTALVDALATTAMCALPSRFEGLGLAALECMAAGVPAVTADFPAACDFIKPGLNGHIFPVGDAGALADLIRWHLAHPLESEVIGRNGRESARHEFCEDAAYLQYLEIYRHVAG